VEPQHIAPKLLIAESIEPEDSPAFVEHVFSISINPIGDHGGRTAHRFLVGVLPCKKKHAARDHSNQNHPHFSAVHAILLVNDEYERTLSWVMPLYSTEWERHQKLQVVRNN
jgi:hypothetical protein